MLLLTKAYSWQTQRLRNTAVSKHKSNMAQWLQLRLELDTWLSSPLIQQDSAERFNRLFKTLTILASTSIVYTAATILQDASKVYIATCIIYTCLHFKSTASGYNTNVDMNIMMYCDKWIPQQGGSIGCIKVKCGQVWYKSIVAQLRESMEFVPHVSIWEPWGYALGHPYNYTFGTNLIFSCNCATIITCY